MPKKPNFNVTWLESLLKSPNFEIQDALDSTP